MPSSDTPVTHVLHKNPIVVLTAPSHAAIYSNRKFETYPTVAFAAEAIGRKYTFSASLHVMDSYA